MLHKSLHKHVSRIHQHIQEHGHKRALVMIMSSMVMMFYPYFSTKADYQLPSGGDITIQYDHTGPTNTDVVATAIATSASGVTFNNVGGDTHTFTANDTFVFEYDEAGTTGTVSATVSWIDKTAPTGSVTYAGDPVTGPVTATLTTSETSTVTNNNGSLNYVFTDNGTFTFEFIDAAGNTGSALAEVSTIVTNPAGTALVDIISPTDNSIEINNSTTVVASVPLLPNSPFQVIVNGLTSGQGTTSASGQINVVINGLSQGQNTLQIQVNDGNGNMVGQSDQVIVTYTPPVVLTGITGTATYSTCTSGQVTATASDFNMTGVSASNNNGSLSYTFTGAGTFTFTVQTAAGNTGSVTATATTGMFANCSTGIVTPPPVVLTGITGIVTYTSGTTVLATVTGFNMTGVYALNNSNSLIHTFTSPGSFTFLLARQGGNTGSVTATATTGMFTTGSTNTGTVINTGTVLGTGVCGTGDITLTGTLAGIYSLTTPVVVGGLFPISWTNANNDCNPDQIVTIQLRDHNGQWIVLGTGALDSTGIVFASTGLAQTGLYTIFANHASGSTYTYTGTSGQQLTGVYTSDTPYVTYTGKYIGSYTGLWTGYELRIINASGVNLLSGAHTFTIDNIPPSVTGFSFIISGANGSGVVGSGGTFVLGFAGSEVLKNIQLLINNTVVASFTGGTATTYSLPGGFGATNLNGPINYVVTYTDLAGNPGTVSGTNIYTIDTIDPTFHGFTVTGSAASGVNFAWRTSKPALYNFQLSLSGSTGAVVPVNTTTYGTSHSYTTTPLAFNKQYLFSIKITDALQNTNFMSGTVAVNASGAVAVTIATQGNNILQLSSQVEAKLFSQILKEEIQNFEECKSELDIKKIDLDLGANKKVSLEIPKVEKTTTRTILNAFAQVLAGKLKTAHLSTDQLDDVQTRANNFFAVTAILEGNCKQNLSAYYINLFENEMNKTKLMLFK